MSDDSDSLNESDNNDVQANHADVQIIEKKPTKLNVNYLEGPNKFHGIESNMHFNNGPRRSINNLNSCENDKIQIQRRNYRFTSISPNHNKPVEVVVSKKVIRSPEVLNSKLIPDLIKKKIRESYNNSPAFRKEQSSSKTASGTIAQIIPTDVSNLSKKKEEKVPVVFVNKNPSSVAQSSFAKSSDKEKSSKSIVMIGKDSKGHNLMLSEDDVNYLKERDNKRRNSIAKSKIQPVSIRDSLFINNTKVKEKMSHFNDFLEHSHAISSVKAKNKVGETLKIDTNSNDSSNFRLPKVSSHGNLMTTKVSGNQLVMPFLSPPNRKESVKRTQDPDEFYNYLKRTNKEYINGEISEPDISKDFAIKQSSELSKLKNFSEREKLQIARYENEHKKILDFVNNK